MKCVRFIGVILLFLCFAGRLLLHGQPSDKVIIGTFLGNEQRNYYGNEAPDTLEVIWKHYLGKGETVISRNLGSRIWAGAGWTGQPLLVEEKGELYLIQGAYDHKLKKIRAINGELVWEYAFDDVVKGTGSIWKNPGSEKPEERLVILQGSRLGVGNFLDTKHIPSYRAISYESGQELWRLDVKWTDSYSRDVDGSALILGDTAYLGLENSLFTVFSPDPSRARMKDGMLQPEIFQERKLYHPGDVTAHRYNVVTESSPSLLGNRIYVASGSGHVWGYNLETRELDWDFITGSDMDGSAVVSADNCIMVSIEKQYIEGQGGAMKLDPSKSPEDAVVWYHPVADSSLSSWEGGIIGSIGMTDAYSHDGDRQFAAFVGIDGYLRVVEHTSVDTSRMFAGPDGRTMYPSPKGIFEKYVGPSISTPIFVGDKLIVAGYHGIHLYRFDPEGNFRLLDKFGPTFESTPIVHNGRIYIPSRNGYLYCLGRK
ncbi:PQQ-binding-like beta-propeller repeat protein [Bacteroidota bacterium]